MSKILTSAQATAIYAAMCTLNNVDGYICASFGTDAHVIDVQEVKTGRVYVHKVYRASGGYPSTTDMHESYANQAAFRDAYELS